MQTRIVLWLRSAWKNLLDFFYPACCAGCERELKSCEQLLCSRCVAQLSPTGFENTPHNPIYFTLAERLPVRQAATTFYFRKQGVMQHLLHKLKYDGRQDIGLFLGRTAGQRLKESVMEEPDFIVPVPLHPKKLKKRGYNQSACIARGIGEFFPQAALVENLLERRLDAGSQTKKDKLSRQENVKNAFRLSEAAACQSRFVGKHFLLVDDVFTTGATVESCAKQLLQIPQSSVSVLTMASPA